MSHCLLSNEMSWFLMKNDLFQQLLRIKALTHVLKKENLRLICTEFYKKASKNFLIYKKKVKLGPDYAYFEYME